MGSEEQLFQQISAAIEPDGELDSVSRTAPPSEPRVDVADHFVSTMGMGCLSPQPRFKRETLSPKSLRQMKQEPATPPTGRRTGGSATAGASSVASFSSTAASSAQPPARRLKCKTDPSEAALPPASQPPPQPTFSTPPRGAGGALPGAQRESPGAQASPDGCNNMVRSGSNESLRSARKARANLDRLLGGARFVGLGGGSAMDEPSAAREEELGLVPVEVAAPGSTSAASPTHGADDDEHVVKTEEDVRHFVDADETEEMPLSRFSLDRKLPGGSMFAALTRIRGTLNSYAYQVRLVGWLEGTKPGTLYALMRRLQPYEIKIVGKFDIDLEIAYKQLQARLAALLLLHKSAKSYNDTKKLVNLLPVLRPCAVLRKFLELIPATLACDLCILESYAIFQQKFEETSKVSMAMQALDFPKLVKNHADARVSQRFDLQAAEQDDGGSALERGQLRGFAKMKAQASPDQGKRYRTE